MADPQQESRMANVVDALNETIDAIDRVELGHTDKHQAEKLYDFKEDLDGRRGYDFPSGRLAVVPIENAWRDTEVGDV